MKTVEEIALEAAVDYLKFKLGDRKGFNVYDIDASDADELIAEIEKECVVSFMDFLARVDAERGKDAVAYRITTHDDRKILLSGPIDLPGHICDPLFLSPTIPPNMVLVPVEPTKEIRIAIWDALTEQRPSLDGVWEKLIQAAGVTK